MPIVRKPLDGRAFMERVGPQQKRGGTGAPAGLEGTTSCEAAGPTRGRSTTRRRCGSSPEGEGRTDSRHLRARRVTPFTDSPGRDSARSTQRRHRARD